MSGDAITPLEELCRTLGVETGYDSGGSFHPAPPESLVAALRALGAPLDAPGEAAEALREVRAAERERILPPASVSWSDEVPSIPLSMPADALDPAGDLEVEILLEDGSRAARRVDVAEIRTGSLPLPAQLPLGYHEVRVAVGSRRGRAFVVRAPRTTWAPPEATRRWATFLPLHAVRREGTPRDATRWGAGDLADLRALQTWTARNGGAWVGTLPLYDLFLAENRSPDPDPPVHSPRAGSPAAESFEPFEPSPYAPVSRQFWNPLWIALDEAPGLDAAAEARALLDDADLRQRAHRLQASGTVDYRAVMALKRKVLEALAEAHRGDGPHGVGRELARWLRDDPEALAYARFRAAVEATGVTWSRWEGLARGGDADALDPPDAAVRYHAYAQWAMERQLRELAGGGEAGLYLDLPLGAHPDGFDSWRHQACFARDFGTGAPPDAFFEGGQDWGFPPLHPARCREDGHRYWVGCLRRTMAVADAVRLDHVMALHRLFWIPRGAAASEGVYVRYPADELWAVLCLESHRHRTEVVGEDLGTVPPEVPRAMERHGARRMWVLPFEVAAGEAGTSPPGPGSVACLNTHDLPPFAAFLEGTDIDARMETGRLEEEEARTERSERDRWRTALAALLRDRGHLESDDPDTTALLRATLRFLATSDAGVVLVNLEDLWLETRPQNVPGTPSAQNWTRKARLSLEEMASDPRVRELLEIVDRCRRAPAPTEGTQP